MTRDILLFLSAGGPDEARVVIESRAGTAYEPRLAGLAVQNSTGSSPGWTNADVGAGAREQAVPAPDQRRARRRRLHGLRRAHRSQIAVATRALDGSGPVRRGRGLAHGSPGRLRHARATRRTRARPRPLRRVERDLGEAGASRIRGVGTCPTPPHFSERASPVVRLAPIGLSPAPADGSTAPATAELSSGGARPGGPRPRRPPTATEPCARRVRTGLAGPSAAEAELMREAGERHPTPKRRRCPRFRRTPASGSGRASSGRTDRARARGSPRPRARPVQPGHRPGLGVSAKPVGPRVRRVYPEAGVRGRAAATLWALSTSSFAPDDQRLQCRSRQARTRCRD